ncbi:MAG: restriction endonuclease subunit S [Leuconostoc mesenteroides]|uniref:restriction endonuclease subunit S n=1 Tax=Leuconostoc TaxID=1243 RepID=UPI000FFE2941|nr:restriction endonuclease subunit S [Leuconostoc mesenteroides]MCI1878253.1 restriction endonuclease subunit S [Leuconostoc mesenteroides]MCI1907794.1 restriction endonuclease subunit S [Leuconostoc mesenteroides]MCT8391628.1 restriction endonuclease subunit S [Leuconostoc mesenteroides]QAT28022.1 restriction endonuclease subunit S [Leuconostoc mesenteroides]
MGDLANIVRGASPRPIQDPKWFDKESNIGWLRISDVTEQNGRIYHLDQHISKLGQEKTRVLTEPHLLLSIAATVGKPLVNYIKTGVHDGFLIFLDPLFEREFMFQWLEMFRPQWKKYGQPGSQVNLNSELIRNQDILIPGNTEQQKIGSFFKQLDNLITQNERKVNLLKQLKQAYLQKIFSQELRFAGFSNAWKERKLKDVTERVRSNDGRMDLPTLTMSASSGWLDQKDRFSGDISGNEKKNYTLLKKGELSYNHGNSKLAKYGVVFSLKNYEEALVPRVYHSFKALANTSADFIEYMFSTKLPDRELGKLVSSGARMDGLLNINYDDFMNIHITFPNYEEQILMSAFFRKLDNTIALHQQKLNLLKKQKQAYLQKMFI